MAKVTIKGSLPIDKVAKSDELSDQLEPFADRVLSRLEDDPNKFFVSTLRKNKFVSRGRRGRVSWQIGAQPIIGLRVEAKRGVFARALAFLKG